MDFNPNTSFKEIKNFVVGKIISDFKICRDGMNDIMIFYFDDESYISFEFDWIYEFLINEKPKT